MTKSELVCENCGRKLELSEIMEDGKEWWSCPIFLRSFPEGHPDDDDHTSMLIDPPN